MLSQHLTSGPRAVDRPTLGRSVALFRAFRVEQTDPDRFYGALAADSVAMLARWTALDGVTAVRSRAPVRWGTAVRSPVIKI